MSVAVSCALSDGVILGADSALTVSTDDSFENIIKVYENAEKIFALGTLPVGIAVYGVATLGARSIGSYLREFEATNTDAMAAAAVGELGQLVESLRGYFCNCYESTIARPATRAEARGKSPDRPFLGLVIGGLSGGQHLPEVWNVIIPDHDRPMSARQARKPGEFGTDWFALYGPIRRYVKGCDLGLYRDLVDYAGKLCGRELKKSEKDAMDAIAAGYEYDIPFASMPLREGIALTRFLVELVINHYRFVAGAEMVGGQVQLGYASYRKDKFVIIRD